MIDKLPVLVLLLVLSIIDIKKREVPHWGVLALFLYALFTVDTLKSSLFWGLYALVGLLVVYFVTRGGVGGGDVKLLTALAFSCGNIFPIYLGCLSLTAGVGFGVGLLYFRKLKFSLPMVPFMFLAYLMLL